MSEADEATLKDVQEHEAEWEAAELCREIGGYYRRLVELKDRITDQKEKVASSRLGVELGDLQDEMKEVKKKLADATSRAARQGELFEQEEKSGERAKAKEQVA